MCRMSAEGGWSAKSVRLVQLQLGTFICRYGVVVSTLVFQTGDTGPNPVTGFNKKFVIFKIFCYNNYRK